MNYIKTKISTAKPNKCNASVMLHVDHIDRIHFYFVNFMNKIRSAPIQPLLTNNFQVIPVCLLLESEL